MQGLMKQFDRMPSTNQPRSVFDRSFGYDTDIYAGKLVPIFWDYVYPGDTMRLRTTAVLRMPSALRYPIVHNLYADTMYFFVPFWQIHSNFFKMMGERYPDPDSSIDFVTPKVTYPAAGFAVHTLYDYLGCAINVAEVNTVDYISNYAARAYNWFYNWFIRDQNLQDSVTVDLDDGPDDPADYVVLNRGKRHDYFTSCLPEPQKGDPVDFPVVGSAPVTLVPHTTSTNPMIAKSANDGSLLANQSVITEAVTARLEGNAAGENMVIDPNGRYTVNFTSGVGATVAAIRVAVSTQQFLEKDMRGGTRYPEQMLTHFGVRTPDARIGKPEYLGGGSERLHTPSVANTAGGTVDQGTLAAYTVGSFDGHGFTKSFTEHGIVMGLINIRADLSYQQGIPREFMYDTRYDFYWPTFAQLGEQGTYNAEIFFQAATADLSIFGYQERYAELRYKPSLVTGRLRSTATTSFDFMTLSQDFSALPELGSTFIQDNPPVSRIVNDTEDPFFLVTLRHDYRCVRPVPMYGVPGLTRL